MTRFLPRFQIVLDPGRGFGNEVASDQQYGLQGLATGQELGLMRRRALAL
jgi:hypothetical protein